jgi:hypothetical protein
MRTIANEVDLSHARQLIIRSECLTFASMKQRRDTSITVRLPLAMKRAVERVAETENRSLSQMVVVILGQFLESRHERPQRNAATSKPKRTRSAA